MLHIDDGFLLLKDKIHVLMDLHFKMATGILRCKYLAFSVMVIKSIRSIEMEMGGLN